MPPPYGSGGLLAILALASSIPFRAPGSVSAKYFSPASATHSSSVHAFANPLLLESPLSVVGQEHPARNRPLNVANVELGVALVLKVRGKSDSLDSELRCLPHGDPPDPL